MADDDVEQTHETLDWRLKKIRPYLRHEFREMTAPLSEALEESVYKKKIFDFERAPFIEKRAIDQGRTIVMSVPAGQFRAPEVYLLTCLQRVELFLHELYRPDPGGEDDERRTHMFKAGVRKVIKEVAAMLPEETGGVWKFRRKMLDLLEEKMWRAELNLAVKPGGPEEMEDALRLAGWLLSVSAADTAAIEDTGALAAAFTGECGGAAAELADRVDKQQ